MPFRRRVTTGTERPIMEKLARIAAAVLCVAFAARTASGLTPQSPEVRAAVERGLKFLETGAGSERIGALGEDALIGLAFLKAHHADHPLVAKSAERIAHAVPGSHQPGDFPIGRWDIYSTGLSLIFLCSYDPIRYRNEITAIIDYLKFRQKSHGGWGYPLNDPEHGKTGDTSQTQYAVLGLWEAIQAGIPVDPAPLDRVCMWLIRTQDPGGGYAYQGHPAPGNQLVRQPGVRVGMGVAGTASLYVCASFMRPSESEGDDGLPGAVQRVPDRAQQRGIRFSVSPALVRAGLNRGNMYIEQNFKIDSGMYRYYYLYTVERYFSFRELVDGRGNWPDWYTAGAEYLLEHQEKDGSWIDRCGKVPDTAFAIMFLVRSTQQAIQKARDFGPGVLVGGRGLPKTTGSVRLEDGRVVALPVRISPDELTSVFDDPDKAESLRKLEALGNMSGEEVKKLLVSDIGEKLKELAGDPSPEARMAAVRALGKAGNLQYVPVLIYALTDPDPAIVLEADRALRRLSRQLTPGLPPGFDETQRANAIAKWKEWYRSIRPDAEFEH
ncbi:MAG: hypothetical protein D6741_04105 [Planctomycetota bacterium]|nr:MAG: hypothetical protein D6741_04105 [Planctomycetota bacterium]